MRTSTFVAAALCIITMAAVQIIGAHPSFGAPDGEANWPQFRGARSLGVSAARGLPDRWSATENVAWKTDIPGRGWSSPIVWGNRLFLTSVVNKGETEAPKKGLYFGGNREQVPASEHEWKIFCLALNTGKVLW